jgi:hypothetical protein
MGELARVEDEVIDVDVVSTPSAPALAAGVQDGVALAA